MTSEEERERAAVYMDGLAQMRSEWARKAKGKSKKVKGKSTNKPKGTIQRKE
jgi:hypothetical protein